VTILVLISIDQQAEEDQTVISTTSKRYRQETNRFKPDLIHHRKQLVIYHKEYCIYNKEELVLTLVVSQTPRETTNCSAHFGRVTDTKAKQQSHVTYTKSNNNL
jgi:hypothetical protein